VTPNAIQVGELTRVSPAKSTPTATITPTVNLGPTRFASPTTVASPTATAKAGQFYTVRSGDTLEKIGASLDIPWQLIAAANGINDNTVLYIGQRLRLPAPTETPTASPVPTRTPTLTPTTLPTALPSATPTPITSPTATRLALTPTSSAIATGPTTYEVHVGDTLIKIGERFGVAWQAIAAVNDITENTPLRVGQELTIPAPGAPIPPTATPRPQPTATLTPTPVPALAAPILTSPGDQTPFSGGDAFIELKWQPMASMPAGAQYQVTVRWIEKGVPQENSWYTTGTSSRAPLWFWQLADQPARSYTWFVTVVQVTTDGQGGQRVVPLSPPSSPRAFSWN